MILDLSDYRARRAAARAYHPAVWTPSDAISTAQAFHAEIDNAEIGTSVDVPPRTSTRGLSRFLFGRSRFRRARVYDGLAVALLMVTMSALGVVVYAASAKADGAVDAWQMEYGPAACSFLADGHNTLAGLSGVILGAEHLGLTPEQAGQAVASSVLDLCPEYTPLLRAFVLRYGPVTTA
jgi:hypothetical protein